MSKITEQIASFADTWERWLSGAGFGPGFGLPPAQERVLAALEDHSGLLSKHLEAILAMDKGQLSRTLHTMRRKGLLTMTPGKEDRRALHISPTPEGKRALARCRDLREQALNALLDPLSRVERRELVLGLRSLEAIVQKALEPETRSA